MALKTSKSTKSSPSKQMDEATFLEQLQREEQAAKKMFALISKTKPRETTKSCDVTVSDSSQFVKVTPSKEKPKALKEADEMLTLISETKTNATHKKSRDVSDSSELINVTTPTRKSEKVKTEEDPKLALQFESPTKEEENRYSKKKRKAKDDHGISICKYFETYDTLKEKFKTRRVNELRGMYRKLCGHDSNGKQKKQMIRYIAIHMVDNNMSIDDNIGMEAA